MDERAYLHKSGLMSAQGSGALLLFIYTLGGPLGTGVILLVQGSVHPPGSDLSPGRMMHVKARAEEAIERYDKTVFSP